MQDKRYSVLSTNVLSYKRQEYVCQLNINCRPVGTSINISWYFKTAFRYCLFNQITGCNQSFYQSYWSKRAIDWLPLYDCHKKFKFLLPLGVAQLFIAYSVLMNKRKFHFLLFDFLSPTRIKYLGFLARASFTSINLVLSNTLVKLKNGSFQAENVLCKFIFWRDCSLADT